MTRVTSIYLDLVRFLAALTVFLVHANFGELLGGLPGLGGLGMNIGNDAVIVFFVLSGLVIAFVADKKEFTIQDFMLSRFARLWSVVAPALILTVVADYIGVSIAPTAYQTEWLSSGNSVLSIAASLFFSNELWFASIRPLSNAPFWSVGYEFWYYVLFAVAFYVRGFTRLSWLMLVSLLVGPRILILLPVWLLGVLVYRVSRTRTPKQVLGWLLVIGSVGSYLLYLEFDVRRHLDELTFHWLGWFEYVASRLGVVLPKHPLGWSQHFLSNYMVGILVAAHFLGIASVSQSIGGALLRLEVPVKYAASYTFSMYLFHFPLLYFFAALTVNLKNAMLRIAIVISGTALAIWLIGGVTEKQKSSLKRLLGKMYSGFVSKISFAWGR